MVQFNTTIQLLLGNKSLVSPNAPNRHCPVRKIDAGQKRSCCCLLPKKCHLNSRTGREHNALVGLNSKDTHKLETLFPMLTNLLNQKSSLECAQERIQHVNLLFSQSLVHRAVWGEGASDLTIDLYNRAETNMCLEGHASHRNTHKLNTDGTVQFVHMHKQHTV